MHTKLGALSGVFLAVMFSARFILEFFKENQILREENMTLNMGHWLSVPVVLVGLYLIFRKTQTTDLTKK
jgi:prolipoprotein diacylglyceryltransferase